MAREPVQPVRATGPTGDAAISPSPGAEGRVIDRDALRVSHGRVSRKAVLAVVPALLMAVAPLAEARAPVVVYQQQTTGQLRLYDAETA